MAQKPLKIFIHAMDGTGHLNACVGLAQALEKRGHKVLFMLNAAFKGQFSAFGFEELLLKRAETPEMEGKPKLDKPVDPVKMFAKMIVTSGMLNGKTPLEKLKEDKPEQKEKIAQMLYASCADFNPQIEKAIQEGKPDLIILDHFLILPAIAKSSIPWLYLFSGNPLAIFNSRDLPPFSSGYPTNSDRKLWEEFRELGSPFQEIFVKYQDKLYREFNYEPTNEDMPSEGSSLPRSKYGYIYGYPKELDYSDQITISENFIQMDAFCRVIPEPFELPEKFASRPGNKIIYFSLGSMVSADVELMKKITAVLAKTPYKCIVSKGPFGDEFDLPENCWGEGYLPQTNILPLVDLVITHGGNNTITETFSFGKPMIVMPFFGDQFDNAQRVEEKGYGARVAPFTFEEQELLDTIDKLLNDTQLKERLAVAAKRIENSNSKDRACEKIEKLVQKYQK